MGRVAKLNQAFGEQVAQLVVLVAQVKGSVIRSGQFRAENVIVVAPILLPLELVYIFSGFELVTGQA